METEIVPRLREQGVQVVVIHSFADARPPAQHTQWFDVSFPVALDFDEEVFRRFRLPEHVFPLHAIIDEEGKVLEVIASLEDAVQAVDALLAEREGQ